MDQKAVESCVKWIEANSSRISDPIEFPDVISELGEGLNHIENVKSENKFLVIAQSSFSGKTTLLRQYGNTGVVPLIIIPCYQNRILVHYRESIECHRMTTGTSNEANSFLQFLTQQERHNAIYHKTKAFLLSYLHIIYLLQTHFKLQSWAEAANKFINENAKQSLLQSLYELLTTKEIDHILIRYYDSFTLSTTQEIDQKIQKTLKNLNFPVIALDDAHFLYSQATGCVFHNNFPDQVEHNKTDLLRCIEHETLYRFCLASDSLEEPSLHYIFPTDVLYCFVTVLQMLYQAHSKSGFRFLLTTSDLRLLAPYEGARIHHLLPLCDSQIISKILSQQYEDQHNLITTLSNEGFFAGRIGIIMKNKPDELTEDKINAKFQTYQEEIFAKVCAALKSFPDLDSTKTDRMRIEEILYGICISKLLQGGILDDVFLVPLLVRSGVGIWLGGTKLSVSEPVNNLIVNYLSSKVEMGSGQVVENKQNEILVREFKNDPQFHDNHLDLFNRYIIQSIMFRFYNNYNQQPLITFMNEWQLDQDLLPQKIDFSDFLINFSRAGTIEDFDISRTEYFAPGIQNLNESILSYSIPSDFPSARSVAIQTTINGISRICFIWFFIKTTSKYLCTGEFLSAMNSLSLHKFIPRKVADRYTLLNNFVQVVSPFEEVIHLRIFICSSGFSSIHIRSIDHFNEQNPEQPIFLVQSNRLPPEIQSKIYGEKILSALHNSTGKHEFFSVRTEKTTHSTLDLSEFVIPPTNELLPHLKQESGQLLKTTIKREQRNIASNTSGSKRSRRKSSQPVRIPKRFRQD